MKEQIKNKVISIFRKFFPEPTEDQLLSKAFKLLHDFRKVEEKIKTKEQFDRYEEELEWCETLIEKVNHLPYGEKKPLLRVAIAFIRLHKNIHIYNIS
jgi:hypothetical protein